MIEAMAATPVGKQEERDLPEVVEDDPALRTAWKMLAKLSSATTMSAASLHVRSGPAHGDADVRGLSAGASFTPSPSPRRSRHDAGADDDPELVFRRDAGEDGDCFTALKRSSFGHERQFLADDDPVLPRPMPSLAPMACAVTAWSPVIITTRMPARRHPATASMASDAADRSWLRARQR